MRPMPPFPDDEPIQQLLPGGIQALVGVALGSGPPRSGHGVAEGAIVMYAEDGICDRLGVIDVHEKPVAPVLDEVRGLPDPGRHQRRPGGHRLEDALGAAFLTRRDDVDVECVVGARELRA